MGFVVNYLLTGLLNIGLNLFPRVSYQSLSIHIVIDTGLVNVI